MSFGDSNKFSIPTIYKGIQMRSKLETKVALFLDYLKIKWEYEPKTFLLSNGIMYKPDFYLPEHKQWIEVKGVVGKNNLEISEIFSRDNSVDLLLISDDSIHFFEPCFGKDNVEVQDGLQIGFCSNCKSYFFTGYMGLYTCRKCKEHNGDHDIFAFINGERWGGEKIDFSDINSIKQWLDKNGTRI